MSGNNLPQMIHKFFTCRQGFTLYCHLLIISVLFGLNCIDCLLITGVVLVFTNFKTSASLQFHTGYSERTNN